MKLGRLFSAIVKVATLPASVVADVVTLGNVGDPYGRGSYTKQKLKKIEKKLDAVTD